MPGGVGGVRSAMIGPYPDLGQGAHVANVELMNAVEIRQPGGPEVLHPVVRARPVAGPGEVLIRVQAAGINRPDVLQRMGAYAPPPGAPDLPGLEVAGTVEACDDAAAWSIGDRVCALVAGGGYAEWCVAPAGQCLPIPHGLTFAEAAALPETYFTVWSNVFDRARLAPGESLLVQGGTSGIGVAAIQLAAALGHTVFATAGSDEKARGLRGAGGTSGHQLSDRRLRCSDQGRIGRSRR